MLFELSTLIHEGIPIYPGTPEESFIPDNRIKNGDPNNTTSIVHFLHTGTHVDAPSHFDKTGLTISDIPIDKFIYNNPMVVNIPKKKGELISKEDLEIYENISSADLLLIHTGYSRFMNSPSKFLDDFPALSFEAAKYLRDVPSLIAIGIDTISIEGINGLDEGFPVHHELLDLKTGRRDPLLVYENVFLSELMSNEIPFRVYAFPLRLKNMDASPVAIVAETIESNN